ncbi:putative tRNA pseudouridine synthase 1-like protein [Halteromyces radiatus]|uniref:putative tRNA pseudouridine synthase 1-like protein n=1 Tax=Halteromyces radiatus TaxID=101107 RepID=UPI00221ED151|nr:putative tRNA pseudouridine synthase 1-like protein [Halteromyces radiatus]KAI8096162.1 putative tRNA pseudouridine synthase 1-like protein [Halteromyces radiatus]
MNHHLKTALNGVFAIYKPKGITSRQAATKVQLFLTQHVLQTDRPWKVKLKDRVKVGMGGILDPMAEGVLVLGLGNGCKQLQSYLKGTKEYEATALLGQTTDTYDAEGTIVHTAPTQHINEDLLLSALDSFRGNILQTPPLYSGLKVQGKRLYNYARQGIEPPTSLIPRQVTLHQIELLDFQGTTVVLKMETSGGFYVRSLIHDLGQSLGCGAHMTRLVRTKQGPWTLSTSLPLLLDTNMNDQMKLDTILEALSH